MSLFEVWHCNLTNDNQSNIEKIKKSAFIIIEK